MYKCSLVLSLFETVKLEKNIYLKKKRNQTFIFFYLCFIFVLMIIKQFCFILIIVVSFHVSKNQFNIHQELVYSLVFMSIAPFIWH